MSNVTKANAMLERIKVLYQESSALEDQIKEKVLEAAKLAEEAKILYNKEVSTTLDLMMAALKEDEKINPSSDKSKN